MNNPDTAPHDTLFHTRRSARYHMRREAFFDSWHKFSSALSVIFGSAAVGALLSDLVANRWALIAAAIVSVFSAIDLIVGSATKARLHNDLRRRWLALECKLISADNTPATIAALRKEYLMIEADEPPVLRALDTICHCDLLQAEGYSADECRYPTLRFYQRWTAHFINWQVSTKT